MAVMVATDDMSIQIRATKSWQKLPQTWPTPVRKVLAARGLESAEDLVYSLEQLPKPNELQGMSEAVSILYQALKRQQRILIVADFDADGATSCAVAIRGLRQMGAQHVDYIVPNRANHGYGLTPLLLRHAIERQPCDVLITVDNGIASLDGVAAAREQGITVIITDHHLPPEVLPDADAIINPNLSHCSFPSQAMAGVGVCFYLLIGLRQYLQQQQWFEQQQLTPPKLLTLIDLVALGTIADVVPLDKLNRTWVQLGLKRIRLGQACEGIKALLRHSGKDFVNCNSEDLGFAIGPKINAAGRLKDMRIGIAALLTDDSVQADQYAMQLTTLNEQRRELEQTMQQQAQALLLAMPKQSEAALAYCLYEERWHQGIIGLLASRITAQYHRPVIAFAQHREGMLKGSARSILGIHIRDVLAHIAIQSPDILSQFGGHAMAAGLMIQQQDLAQFSLLLEQAIVTLYGAQPVKKVLLSDGQLALSDMTLSLATVLTRDFPWGQGFESPRFHGVFELMTWSTIGKEKQHLKCRFKGVAGQAIAGIAFNTTRPDWLDIGEKVELYYQLQVNYFYSQPTVQLNINQFFPAQH